MVSTFPRPYPSQFDLRGETLTCYGSDFRDIVNYTFNSQGYRADFDFDLADPDPIVVALGSSIATGHGIEIDRSFASLVATKHKKKLWNLGQGCFRSSNQTILEQIEYLVNNKANIDFYIVQFTHINRQGNKFNSYLELEQDISVKNFQDILTKITDLLANKKWCWLLTDYSGAVFDHWVVNHPNKISIDPEIVDHIAVKGYEHLAPSTHAVKLLSLHPGPKWHLYTAKEIINFYNNTYEHQQSLEK